MILCFKRFSPPLFDDKGIIPQKGVKIWII
nr:MAG TPA: hypothetical protein [Caudoviricetes sp.]